MPAIRPSAFQSISEKPEETRTDTDLRDHRGTSKVASVRETNARRVSNEILDEWGDGGIDDDDFVDTAEPDAEFVDIDELESDSNFARSANQARTASGELTAEYSSQGESLVESVQLKNGKWACSHPCKDKATCRHMCCREGLDKKPKPKAKAKESKPDNPQARKNKEKQATKTQSNLDMAPRKKTIASTSKNDKPEHIDLSNERPSKKAKHVVKETEARSFNNLRKKTETSRRVSNIRHQEPAYSYRHGGEPQLDFLNTPRDNADAYFEDDDFDDLLMDELTDASIMANLPEPNFSSNLPEADTTAGVAGPGFEADVLDPSMAYGHYSPMASTELPESTVEGLSKTYTMADATKALDGDVMLDDVDREYTNGDDQDMLDAVLIGAEDSQILSSQSGIFTTRDPVEHGGLRGEPSSHSPNRSTLPALMDPVEPVKADPGTPELRAWLAAELGDSVELVDSME